MRVRAYVRARVCVARNAWEVAITFGPTGRVEFTVEMGQELTGHGMTPVSRLPPQQGLSDHAYRRPVMTRS